MKRDGAICVKSYRESGFGADAGRLPVPNVEMIRAVVATAHAHGMPVFLHANSMAAQAFAVEAGVDVIAHGMWNGHQSTAGALDKGVEPVLQAILMRGMGYQPTAQVIRGLGAVLDERFFADPLVSRVYSPTVDRLVPLTGRGLVRKGRTRRHAARGVSNVSAVMEMR